MRWLTLIVTDLVDFAGSIGDDRRTMSHSEDGISRRSLLQGLVVLPVLACGCQTQDPGSPDGGTGDAGSTGATMCGPNLCIDLANAANTSLGTVGGSRIFAITGDTLIVIRTSTTEFSVLSNVCTHARCAVRYVTGSNSFACPCHGSKFAITGAVTNGPANRPLKTYTNTFDSAASTVTVMLA